MDSSEPTVPGEVWNARIREHLILSAELKRQTAAIASESILAAANLLVNCFRSANKVLICGNGGSAADSQHMASELLNRLSVSLQRPGFPAIALTTDTSFLTSYANDVGYEGVFERQVLALGAPKDVLIGISTSGNSPNVLKAVIAARQKGMRTIGLSGDAGQLMTVVDQAVIVPSQDTQFIQETLLSIEHVICSVVEEVLCQVPTKPAK